jgi:peptidyl-prolyl cis-trans isomerase B (cyclophilin B)
VTIRDTKGMTFEQIQTEKLNLLQPRIDDGSLVIKFTGTNEVQGRDTYSLYAQGLFIKNSGDTFTPEETIDVVFAEVMIYSTPKYYIFSTSSDDIGGFDKQVQNLERAIHSFQILSETGFVWQDSVDLPTKDEGGGCLIATAAYGSEMAPQVQFLRELRDNTVLQTQVGANFMTEFNQFYYSFSPAVADYERENPMFKEAVKVTLTPLLTSLAILNYVDIDTEQEMLGYGIGVILLNIGMYFVAPAAVIIAIKNRRK